MTDLEQTTIRNQQVEIAGLCAQNAHYKAILALSKEANQVIVEALKFYQQDPIAAQALAKYSEIKRRAQDLIKPL